MASESIGLDDIVATLMSMGFEFNDCQEAITNGKLTVQAAVDWILAGKPGNVAPQSQPALKLNKSQGSGQLQGGTSNPFVPENVSALKCSSGVEPSSSSEIMGVDTDESAIVSRSHLSEKQQQIKLSFEEKERQEARRLVHEEKRKKKLERERILKEIQEDREKLKLTKQSKTDQLPESSQQSQPQAPPPQQQQATTNQSTSSSEDTSNGTASIQVRLPSGRMFRHSFPVTATLNNVWDEVYTQIKSAMNAHSGFIQPFPRHEYTKEEMSQTLKELGLVPSGSLVLKKKDVQQAAVEEQHEPSQPPAIMRALDEADRERRLEDQDFDDYEEDPAAAPQHRWGRGFRMEGGQEMEGEEPMDIAEEAQGQDFGGADPLAQFMGLAEHPILGNQRVFSGYGQRLVPAGVPGDDGRHLHRSAGGMAAEAAAQRAAQPQAPVQDESRSVQSEHVFIVHSLQDLAMYILARRLSDPRKPIYSMTGLPEALLQKFLAYLMKERLLKPKILQLMPSYLLKLVLDYYPYTTNELLHAARIFVHLQTLSLSSCTLITDSGLVSIKGMRALKNLNLSGCSQITNACFAVASELKNLQTLNLDGTGVTDTGVIEFASSDSCPQLLHLDLSRTAVTHAIFTCLQNLKKLRSLFLKNSHICSLAGLDGVVTLENLDISDTHIVTDSILCLTRLSNLHNICLTNTQEVHGDRALYYLKDMKLTGLLLPSRSTTSDVGMAYISGFHLSALDLTNYTNVGDTGMVHVGKILSLKKLLLSNTKVTDEGMQHLAGLVNLEVLLVDRTFVSNAGAAIVRNFKNLNELSLSATSITSDFLKQGSLNSCISLTKLSLRRTIIGDRGITSLVLPNLQLLNLDCTRVHPQSVSVIEKNCPNVKTITLANLSTLREDEEER